jgi:hypothetical protein
MLVQFGRMKPEQITAAISLGDPDDVLPLEKLLLLMQVAPTEVRAPGRMNPSMLLRSISPGTSSPS